MTAVALDASTPAWSATVPGTNLGSAINASAQATLTSASFSPPANSLVAVMAILDYGGSPSVGALGITVADSLSGSYALSSAVQLCTGSLCASLGIFWNYYAAAPGSITVTETAAAAEVYPASTTTALELAVLVFTGAGSAQSSPGYLVTSGSSGTCEGNVVTTAAGSMVVLCCVNGSGGGFTPESGTTTYGSLGGDPATNSTAFGCSAAATVTPGSTSFGWTCSSAIWGLAALEILPVIGTNTSAAYAASYDTTAVSGTGTWTNPADAEGTGTSPYATWTAP